MKLIREIQRRRARGDKMRPWWQIAYLVPLWPIYLLANAFVEWMDNQ